MIALRLLVPLAAGLLAAAGQAPWNFWPLALLGYVLGLSAVAGSRWPFLTAYAFGAAHFALALIWITEPFQVDAAATGWLAPLALAGMALGFGLFWALGGWAGRRWLGGPLGVALGLAAAELARSYVLTGFPWALPGHVLIGSPALPAASYSGAHGLGLAVLVGAGLVAAWRVTSAAAGVLVWAVPFAIAATLPPAPAIPADAATVRLIQPNAPQHLKWDPDWVGVFFRRGLEETAAPAEESAPVAMIWPETAMPRLLARSEDARAMIGTAAGGRPVMVGAQRYDPDGQPRNTLALLDGETGEIGAVHDKHRLVPFGEFLPFPRLFAALGMGPLAGRLAGTYAPGEGPALVDLPGVGPVLPMICYEAIFPQDIRRVERPRALVHLTNDAWFGTRVGPQQHLALARLRAAETGLPLLRAANTGVSAAIDARGAVIRSLPLGVSGHIDVAVPPALAETPYLRIGDWGVLAALLLLMIGLRAVARKPVEPAGDRP